MDSIVFIGSLGFYSVGKVLGHFVGIACVGVFVDS